MSLDKLLIIFIIIILPIAFVLNTYVNFQAETLNMQSLYDGKLYNATNDALKAYQSNAFNESASDLSTLHMKNVEASANVFLNSIANNFSMQGFSKETLQSHIPALVFTMHDGFYIYSKYENNIGSVNYYDSSKATYHNGDLLWGVKPFVPYSCRYQVNGDDFVITYSLDNYITIQGTINNKWVNDAGYVIDTNNIEIKDGTLKYRGNIISRETIFKEYVGKNKYPYQKVNGIKYYYDENHTDSQGHQNPKWFSLINGKKVYNNVNYDLHYDYSAYNYYRDAYNFTNRLINIYQLEDLRPSDAVEAYNASTNADNGETFYEYNFYTTNPEAQIFKLDSIEEPSSNFNAHRLAVIRYSIEKNLSIAIANYNNYSGGLSTDFQMPILNETEWDKVLNNITLISFLQGLPMGNKIYNGCCVVQNNKNEEVVAEDSIYLVDTDPNNKDIYFYNVKSTTLKGKSSLLGILNCDLEKRYFYDETGSEVVGDYYYPKFYYADYGSIINSTNNVNLNADTTNETNGLYAYNGNIYKYMKKAGSKIATAYYTALGRERYSTYKISEPYRLPKDLQFCTDNRHKYYMFDSSQMEYFNNSSITWNEAEAYCESLGGHLATINTWDEENFIKEHFSSSEKIFVGITGEELYHYKWITDEPIEIEISFNKWITENDKKTSKYFICEWE